MVNIHASRDYGPMLIRVSAAAFIRNRPSLGVRESAWSGTVQRVKAAMQAAEVKACRLEPGGGRRNSG
jgi:hypothetical protein